MVPYFHKKTVYLVLSLIPYTVFANPQGCDPRFGTATLSHPNPSTLAVHTSDKAIIHWDSFSISEGETTRFIMPNSSSAVLNRVAGGVLSEIYGSLEANGKVFLINPKGIIFGERAQIDTASFFASTLDALDVDFLKGGDIPFTGDSTASIINLGTISAWDGDVALIAYQVDNKGVIEAKNGVATLAAGTNILLAPGGSQRVLIRACSLERREESVGIDNSGAISALQAELIADGNPYQFAIKDSGQIDALAVEKRGGHVYLVAEGGRVDATGSYAAMHAEGQGGEVRLLGSEVYVDGDAAINTSGRDGGGIVLVGGDYQGKNPDIPNAQVTFVGKKAQINADALENGDGGKVILWGDQATGFYGNITAQGGELSGNGGFIEVSAQSNNLYFEGQVNTLAPHGSMGTLLLDPGDINIVPGPSTLDNPSFPTFFSPGNPIPTNYFAPTCSYNPATLSTTTLNNALQTSYVQISTADSCSTGLGVVTFTGDVEWDSNGRLYVTATRSIVVSANISAGESSGGEGGSIFFTAKGGGDATDATSTNGILINSPYSVSVTSGLIDFVATGVPYEATFPGLSNGIAIYGTVSAGTGDISMTGTGGAKGNGNVGILISGAGASVSASNNEITLIGTGGLPTNSDQASGMGILVQNGAALTNEGGQINLTGTAIAYGFGIPAIAVGWLNGGTSSATTGDINITANILSGQSQGKPTSTAGSQAVSISTNSQVSTDSGSIHINATNSAVTAAICDGVDVLNNSSLSTQSGDMFITSSVTAGLGNTNAVRVQESSGGNSSISAGGKLSISATNSSPSGSGLYGVHVQGTNALIRGNGITGSITGSAGGSTTSNFGVYVESGGAISNVPTITGTGGGGTDSTQGVLVTGLGSSIGATIGPLTITGTGGGSGTNADGIAILASGAVASISTGGITLAGTASPSGGAGNAGVTINSGSVETNPGNIAIAGTAGGGSTTGIIVENNADVSALTSGTIALTSGNGDIVVAGGTGRALVYASNGDITIQSGRTLTVSGGSTAGAYAQITVGNQANSVTIDGGISMQGATAAGASGAYAEISTLGGQIVIDGAAGGAGSISLTGGAQPNTEAQIITKASSSAIQIGQTTPPTALTLQGGSGGTNSKAIIATDAGGDINCRISGQYAITGGSTTISTDDGRAGFYSGLSSGSGNIQLTGANFNLTGGSNAGINGAQIATPAAGGSITMTATTSATSTLQGGSGPQTAAQIIAQGVGDISMLFSGHGPLSLLGSTTAGGTDALASITTANGSIGINAGSSSSSGLVTLRGGTQPGAYALIAPLTTTKPLTINSAGIAMQGGTAVGASGAYAEISTLGGAGGIITIDGAGPITLTGGVGVNTQAQIITKTNSLTGTAIQIGLTPTTSPTSISLQGGSGGTNSRAVIATDVGGDILCSSAGSTITNYTITGGTTNGAISDDGRAGIYTGLTSGMGSISLGGNAYALTGGATGQGQNFAEIATQIQGNVVMRGSGGFTLSGGTGTHSHTAVTATLGSITSVMGGDYSLSGGNGNFSSASFSAYSDIKMTGNKFTLKTGAGTVITGASALITSTGQDSSIVLRASDKITLDATSAVADSQSCLIETTNLNGNNPINIFCRGLEMTGGNTSGSLAQIMTNQGPIRIASDGDVTITGGSASAASAGIQCVLGGYIALAAHNLTVRGGGAATTSGIQTTSGNIAVACAGDCTYLAPNATGLAIMETFGSDLLLAASGSIDLSGYTVFSTPDAGNLLMIAGVDISIGDLIGNPTQVIAYGTDANSSLTLVVDEQYPTPPGVGPGAFTLHSGATLTTGSPSPTASPVPVRIFTAKQNQNSISATINDETFVPGPEFVNSNTEEWGVYFPSDIYNDDTSFMIFYKNTNEPPPPPPPTPPGGLSAHTLARVLYQAAVVDSELFYELGEMDWYAFDDTFYFSTFDVWLDREQHSQAISQRGGLTCYNDEFLAASSFGDIWNSRLQLSPGFGKMYSVRETTIPQKQEIQPPVQTQKKVNRRKILTSYMVVDDKGLSVRRRRWQNRHDLLH